MELKKLNMDFTVCKVPDYAQVDIEEIFCFTGKTDEECSLVCRTENVPPLTFAREDGWMAFRIQGVLDFSLIGILARISAILAENHIGIFVVSTYNTDYVFVKKDQYETAISVLSDAGYTVIS